MGDQDESESDGLDHHFSNLKNHVANGRGSKEGSSGKESEGVKGEEVGKTEIIYYFSEILGFFIFFARK